MEEIMENTAFVRRFRPHINERPETHLEFSVFYESADGRLRSANGTMAWGDYDKSDSLLADVLRLQAEFVRQKWTRIEVCIPNRDHYGNLQSGFIKETGLLLATRQTH